jgi:hypothetical protein
MEKRDDSIVPLVNNATLVVFLGLQSFDIVASRFTWSAAILDTFEVAAPGCGSLVISWLSDAFNTSKQL